MDDAWAPEPAKRGRKPKKQKVEVDYGSKPAPGVEEGIEVKTKFPVARIKRIMQADEDVGKVAQVTPTAVCKSKTSYFTCLPSLPHSEMLLTRQDCSMDEKKNKKILTLTSRITQRETS